MPANFILPLILAIREHTVWNLGFFSTPKMNVQGFISKHAPLSSSCFKFSSNCNITFSFHKQIPFTLCANFIWMSHLPLPQWYASTCVVQINKNSWRELGNEMDLRYSLVSPKLTKRFTPFYWFKLILTKTIDHRAASSEILSQLLQFLHHIANF